KSARLAYRVRALRGPARARAIAEHHRRELEATSARLAAVAGTPFLRARGRLLGRDELDAPAVAPAPPATMTKIMGEAPELGTVGIDAGSIPRGDVAAWAVIGQKVWSIFAAKSPVLLDARSRALVAQVHNAGPVKSTPAEVEAMIARLEQGILADTALN